MRIMSKSDALHAAAGFAFTVAFWVLCLLTSFEFAFGMLAGQAPCGSRSKSRRRVSPSPSPRLLAPPQGFQNHKNIFGNKGVRFSHILLGAE